MNYREGDIRFSDVQLGDLGGTYPTDSKYAKEGTPVGAPMWTSPEVIMETSWNTATDIWSFGTVVHSNRYLTVRLRVLIIVVELAAYKSYLRRQLQPFPSPHCPLRPRRIRVGGPQAAVPILWSVPREIRRDCKPRDNRGYSVPHAGDSAIANNAIP